MLQNTEIAALTIGLSILALGVLSATLNKFSFFTDDNRFFLKKWLYIAMIALVNTAGCVLVYYTKNLQVIIYIILLLKSKDILMSVMFVFNMIYKAIFYDNSIPEIVSTDESDKIVAFIPAYKESIDQVTKTIDSLINNTLKPNLICLISDGEIVYDEILENILMTKNFICYTSWKGDQVITHVKYGNRKNVNILIIKKDKNYGKKDSIIICNDLFNYSRSNIFGLNKDFKSHIMSDLSEVFGLFEFDYLFCTDADTILDENTLICLTDSIKKTNAVASCGIVNVDFTEGTCFWNHLQNFQYLYGQYIRRTNEDIFGQVLCLPGCITMFKIQETNSESLTKYSELPDIHDFIKSNVQYVGTDRRYTSLLTYTNKNARIVLDTRCNAYTIPPANLDSYIQQRKRWCHNTYFNSMINIIGPNVNFVLRFFNLIEYLRLSLLYFRLFNTLYFIYLLASSYKSQNVIELIPYTVILIYPVLCFFVYSLFNTKLRKQYLSLFLSMIANKIFSMFSTVVIFNIMLLNIGNNSWNKN
jgi:chitin synthase